MIELVDNFLSFCAEWYLRIISLAVFVGLPVIAICLVYLLFTNPSLFEPHYDKNGCYKDSVLDLVGFTGNTPIYISKDKLICDPSKASSKTDKGND